MPPVRRLSTFIAWLRGSAFRSQLGVLVVYLALGVLVTWPHATYLAGKLPNIRDQAAYVWDMWWMAHQIEHLSWPYTSNLLWAPAGAPLAYHALEPLLGVLMFPITITLGPAFSVTLFSVALPGLIAYAMYRAARLWLDPLPAFATGAFFGFASMVDWRTWFHENLAAGILFLPIVLEVTVRLRRDPSRARAAVLGLVLGLMLLTDQESTVMGAIIVAVVLAGWVLPRPLWRNLGLVGLAAAVSVVVASPQIIAMIQQSAALGQPHATLGPDFVSGSAALPQLFAPSPRVGAFGLSGLAKLYYEGKTTEGMATFGVTLTVLALLGALVGWRRRRERTWLALWFCDCVLALGPVVFIGGQWHNLGVSTDYYGQQLSVLMPYTWFVRLPAMSSFRYASRFTPLGLLAASLLAGSAVGWIRARRAAALVPVAAVAALELGWSAPEPLGTMPAGLPAVDRAIKADHSHSVVVDVPLGFRSGTRIVGAPFPPEEEVEATLDGHPRAIGYLARMSAGTAASLETHRFYTDLIAMQFGKPISTAQVAAAKLDAERINVGWVLVWPHRRHQAPGLNPAKLVTFLSGTGFMFRYRADGVSVYQRVRG
jgi:hypothetical protein